MSRPTDDARTLRELFRSAAAEPRLPRPLPILAKCRTPLARQGESLGELEALLRLSFRPDEEPEGILVFEWPDAAASHSAIGALDGWNARCGADGTARHGTVSVESRRTSASGDGPVDRTHLKLHFPVAEIPDELLDVLQLAIRIGLGRLVRAPLERALREATGSPAQAVATVTGNGTAKAAANGTARVVVPPPPAEPAKAAAPERTPEELARADAITAGTEFDPGRHPQVELNQEVTNSEGATFRLVWKRALGAHRRIWMKVPSRVEAPAVTHTRPAGAPH